MSNWNRIYRPRTIAGLHLQSVREQFQSLLKSGSLPQVFVFAGPKGTGKTSTARIIGALVNNPENKTQIEAAFFAKKSLGKPLIDNEPKDEQLQKIFEGNSYVVQELDAASNRGIDDVRALKERVSLPPSFGLVSVYILDEAHMLTTEAFNALLKLLEEPPEHAIFILATTELHKIPETIISRAHVIHFKKASPEELTIALEQVLKKEDKTYEKEAVALVAKQADGSFRDAIKILESLAQTGAVTLERLNKSSNLNYEQQLKSLIKHVVDKNVEGVVTTFAEAREQNVSGLYFHTTLLQLLHVSLQQSLGIIEGDELVQFEVAKFLLTELSSSALSEASPIVLLPLEMKIIDIISRSKKKPPVQNDDSSGNKPRVTTSNVVEKVAVQPVQKVLASQPEKIEAKPPVKEVIGEASYSQKADGAQLATQWIRFVELMAVKNATVAALLRSAHPVMGEEGQITVKVFYKFHQEQLKSTKFNQMIRACAEEMLQGSMEFVFVVEEPILATDLTDVTNMQELSTVAAQALL